MPGTAPHKSGRYRDLSRSDNHTQASLDVRYLPQRNKLMATNKIVMRLALEYASSIWSPLALRTATGCAQDIGVGTGGKRGLQLPHIKSGGGVGICFSPQHLGNSAK